jgi:hypothetical protein
VVHVQPNDNPFRGGAPDEIGHCSFSRRPIAAGSTLAEIPHIGEKRFGAFAPQV